MHTYEPLLADDVCIIDIDGVVCNSSVRQMRTIDGAALARGDLKAFRASLLIYGQTTDGDVLIPAGAMIVDMCRKYCSLRGACRIFYITSRNEWSREPTLNWLRQHDLFHLGDELFMQPVLPEDDDNWHNPAEYKEEIAQKLRREYNIQLAVDDNTDVCKMYQRIGIPTMQARFPGIDCLTLVGDSGE